MLFCTESSVFHVYYWDNLFAVLRILRRIWYGKYHSFCEDTAICSLCPIPVCINSIFFAPNSVSYDVESLDGRAKITSITSKVEGRKNGKHYKTVVEFSDGFRYETDRCNREQGVFSYTISIDEALKQGIIEAAIQAHDTIISEHHVNTPNPFICGKCGRIGDYSGNCPDCGSSLKRYI